jgi:hypothetical protein
VPQQVLLPLLLLVLCMQQLLLLAAPVDSAVGWARQPGWHTQQHAPAVQQREEQHLEMAM